MNFDGLPRGLPVNPNELFAELKGLDKMPYLFGLSKYAGDYGAINALYSALEPFSARFARQRGWRVRQPKAVPKCAILALDMHIYPQTGYCRRCQGSGSSRYGLVCKSCGGAGTRPMTNSEVGRLLGVSPTAVRKVWNLRLDAFYRLYAGWDYEIHRHLRKSNEAEGYG